MNENYKFIPFVLNNLETNSDFNIDLYDLFGTEDGVQKGIVGKWDSSKNDFTTPRWDWNVNGLKYVFRVLYYLSKKRAGKRFTIDDYNGFYESKIKGNSKLLETLRNEGIVPDPFYMIYLIKYKKQFPGLVIEVKNLEWDSGKVWITFEPIKYFVTDGDSWQKIRSEIFEKNDYDWANWALWLDLEKDDNFKKEFFKDTYQRIFGIVPLQLFVSYAREGSLPKIFYLKKVERKDPGLFTDNQVFWNLFHHVTGAKQIIEDIRIPYGEKTYKLKGLQINTLDRKNLVFKQEYGVPNVLCNTLLEKYGADYLNVEFGTQKIKNSSDSTILKRAFKVGEIAGEENSSIAENDYDYCLDLNPLGKNNLLLFDLTVGLWKKGRREYEEYLQLWRKQIFEIISRRNNLRIVWYIAVDVTERKFFEDNLRHNSFQSMLEDITTDLELNGKMKVVNGSNSVGKEKILILPLFRDSPNARNVRGELDDLINNYKETDFYSIVRQIV